MKERLEQIKHIENMISDLNKAINNANQFGDEETVKAINNQINRYREVLESLKEEELEEQVVRVFNNKLEGKITLENNNLGLYQSCTEDELIVVESNLLNSAKELGIEITFKHEF